MSTTLIAKSFNLPAPSSSLDAYIQQVNQLPLLSEEQEQELAQRLQRHHDLEAARQLVLSHLRFVVAIARQYKGYGLALGDMIQEGNIGLMKAVRNFDPERKVRLAAYAVHWIKAEIHEFILRNWRIVKVATTKAQRKLFFNLRRSKERLGWLQADEVEQVASELDVNPDTVREMESRLSGQDIAYDGEVDFDDSEDEGFYPAPVAYLAAAESYDPLTALAEQDWQEQHQNRALLALEQLDERSRDIIERRWLHEPKVTLQELADTYGVSAERIRQLENAALNKLKSHAANN